MFFRKLFVCKRPVRHFSARHRFEREYLADYEHKMISIFKLHYGPIYSEVSTRSIFNYTQTYAISCTSTIITSGIDDGNNRVKSVRISTKSEVPTYIDLHYLGISLVDLEELYNNPPFYRVTHLASGNDKYTLDLKSLYMLLYLNKPVIVTQDSVHHRVLKCFETVISYLSGDRFAAYHLDNYLYHNAMILNIPYPDSISIGQYDATINDSQIITRTELMCKQQYREWEISTEKDRKTVVRNITKAIFNLS